ncbi:MAG: hypothetical protein MHPSP_000461, partial [Paramarteilia canceri]
NISNENNEDQNMVLVLKPDKKKDSKITWAQKENDIPPSQTKKSSKCISFDSYQINYLGCCVYEPSRNYDFDNPENNVSDPESDSEADNCCNNHGSKNSDNGRKVTTHCNMKHTKSDYSIAKENEEKRKTVKDGQ